MTKICVEFLQCELVQHNIPFHLFYKYTDNKAGQNSTIMYSSTSNRSPGHSYYFPTIFVPGHSLLKTGRQLIFEKSRHIKVKLSLLFPSLASRK